jgi:Flp pilus assembly protein TadB
MKQIYVTLAVYVVTSLAWLVICWFMWNQKEQPVMNNTKEIKRIDSTLNANAGALKEYKLQQKELQQQLYEIDNKKAERTNKYYIDFNRINSVTNVDEHAVDSVFYYLQQLDKQRYFEPNRTIRID